MSQTKNSSEYTLNIHNRRAAARERMHLGEKRRGGLSRVFAIGAVAAGGVLGGANVLVNAQEEGKSIPPATTMVTADEGDSLWSLQEQHEGFGDNNPNAVVDKVVEMHDGNPSVELGEQVAIVDYPNPQP